jgi:tetratricopeptide (TPR) repeat protein
VVSAGELHRRGLVETNAGRHAQARTLFLRALDRGPDAELTARILLSLAHAQFELGSTGQALGLCRRALATPGISAQTQGLIHSQLGVVHSRAGNGAEALAEFGRALTLLDASPEPRATALLNRGNVHLLRRDLPRALADFSASQRTAAAAGLEVIRAKAEHNLGYTSMLRGDITVALRHMDHARETLESLSAVYLAVCNQERAEVLVAAGMVSEAGSAFRTAARAYGSHGLKQRQGEAELVLARLLLRTDPREAGRVARRAAARFRSRGSESWALRADLVAASSAVAIGRWSTGAAGLDRLAADLVAHGLRHDAKMAALQAVQVDVRAGRLADASQRLRRVRVTGEDPLATRLLAREARARLARVRGDRSTAMRQVRRGLSDLHQWQSSFGSLDLQSSLVGHGRTLALEGLGLAVEDGRPTVVFEWAERARALAGRVTPLRPPTDPETADTLAELRRLQSEIDDAEASGVLPRTLTAHANRLRDQIRQRDWYGEGSGVVVEPAALDQAVAALEGSDGAIVSYLVVGDHAYCLVVTAGHPVFRSLGPFSRVRAFLDGMQADLDLAAAALPGAMRAAIRDSLDHRLRRLAEVLVTPLDESLPDGPVVVVPSGLLAGVPWSLLPGFSARPLTVPRSATSWLGSHGRPFSHRRAGFVAGPRVDRAHEEVTRASSAWSRAEVLVGDDARSGPVRSLASSVDVFHAAAHGRHSADNPLFSGLELADGAWFGYDIDQLDAIPSTVLLSACEVGRSSVRWGEETIGMTVAWLHAGARCVIASPALVSDDVACEVLGATHQRLTAGVPPAVALCEATARANSDGPSPFICFGTGW